MQKIGTRTNRKLFNVARLIGRSEEINMGKEDCPTYETTASCNDCPAHLVTVRMRRVNEFDFEEIIGTEVAHCSKNYF